MDPISAIGFASAILSFVEFAAKVVSTAKEIRSSASGAKDEHEEIGQAIARLDDLTRHLSIQNPGPTTPLTPQDKRLLDLQNTYTTVSSELQDVLKPLRLKKRDSKSESIWLALKIWKNKKIIEELQSRLDRCRDEAVGFITTTMKEEITQVRVLLKSATHDNENFHAATMQKLEEMQVEIMQRISTTKQSTGAETGNGMIPQRSDTLDQIKESLTSLTNALRVVPSQSLVLNRLWFPSIYRREHSVDTEHEGTFRWLLNDPSGPETLNSMSKSLQNPSLSPYEIWQLGEEAQRRQSQNEAFNGWLRSGHGVFHISGKAGSGKSTLMKFLTRQDKTRQLLEEWAGEKAGEKTGESGKKLVLGCFFFWSSGDLLQRSLEGLYRTILWDVLSQRPDLIEQVFPKTRSSRPLQRMLPESLGAQIPFERDELLSALVRLFGLKDSLNHSRLCLFIDGLDEYKEEQSTNYWQLCELLLNWSSTGNVKFCVSSRPYNAFMERFGTDPTKHFKLHDLTRLDMYQFVFSEFLADKGRQSSRVTHYETDKLVSSIVEKADGIFLWTRLVTSQLLKAMGDHCTSKQLTQKLRCLPPGLGALFRQMIQAIDKSDRTRAAQTLLILKGGMHVRPGGAFYHSFFGLYTHWILDEMTDDPSMMQSLMAEAFEPRWSYTHWLATCRRDVSSRIVARCQGLVEVSDAGSQFGWLTFTHRSVADFLSEDEGQNTLQDNAPGFVPERAVLLAVLAWIKFQKWPIDVEADDAHTGESTSLNGYSFADLVRIAIILFSTCYDMDKVTDREESAQMLDCLVRASTQVAASLEMGCVNMMIEPGVFPLRCDSGIYGSTLPVESNDVEAVITCYSIIKGGLAPIILERVGDDRSLLAPRPFGGNVLLAAAQGHQWKGDNWHESDDHILENLVRLEGSDINAPCGISYDRYISHSDWDQNGPQTPTGKTGTFPYLSTPPWTAWTAYLFTISLNSMSYSKEGEAYRINYRVRDDFEGSVMGTLLENKADPSACFVGYTTNYQEFSSRIEEVDLCYVTLRDMMVCWGLTMTPRLVQLLEGSTQSSTWSMLKAPYEFIARAVKPPARQTLLRRHELRVGERFRTLKIVSLEQLPDISVEELESMRKIMFESSSTFYFVP